MNKSKISTQMLKMLVIKFAGTFGSGMLNFAIGLYILHRTGSALGMGVSMITGPIVSLILTPFVGYIVDTMNHRKIMITAQITTSLGLLVFGLVFHNWPAQYFPELIGLIILLQVTDNFLSTSLTASLVQLFKGAELQRVNSLNQSITSLAAFLAPIIGALVYTLVAIDTFAYIEILFEVTALIGIVFLNFNLVKTTEKNKAVQLDTADSLIDAQNPTAEADGPKESIWQNFQAGFHYLRHQKLMLIMMISSAGINFFFAALNVGEPYLLVNTLKLSNTQYGITDSAFAVGMFLGGLLLGAINLKQHPVNISYTCLAVLSGLLFILGIPELVGWTNSVNTIYYVVLNAFNGIILVFINTPIMTFMQQLIPHHMQGRVFSLSSTIGMMMMPLGTILYGAMFDHMTAFPIFVITGVVLLSQTLIIRLIIARQHLLELPENQVQTNAEDEAVKIAEELSSTTN